MLFSLVGFAINVSIQLLALTFRLTVWLLRVVFELLGLCFETLGRGRPR
jgi:hypothetical protein